MLQAGSCTEAYLRSQEESNKSRLTRSIAAVATFNTLHETRETMQYSSIMADCTCLTKDKSRFSFPHFSCLQLLVTFNYPFFRYHLPYILLPHLPFTDPLFKSLLFGFNPNT